MYPTQVLSQSMISQLNDTLLLGESGLQRYFTCQYSALEPALSFPDSSAAAELFESAVRRSVLLGRACVTACAGRPAPDVDAKYWDSLLSCVSVWLDCVLVAGIAELQVLQTAGRRL